VTYEVSTPVFQGPFDLLLELIAAEQVDLYEVSITGIVDAYLAELERMERLDLEMATEFTLIAATLIELKCRRLLPGREGVELDEELALWEERDLLLARLLECKTFKDAAGALGAMAEEASGSVARTAGPDERFAALVPDLLEGVGPEDIRLAAGKALSPRPVPKVDLSHLSTESISVAEVTEGLKAELVRAGRTTFRDLTAHLSSRMQVIAHFLALLELYKQGLVELDQVETFGRLHIAWVGAEGPPGAERAGEERARAAIVLGGNGAL
jgi:segregation and condensation protein A